MSKGQGLSHATVIYFLLAMKLAKKFLIKPSQGGLAGKVSHYRNLGWKKFRLNHCCTKPLRGSFLVVILCPFIFFDALSSLWIGC